MTAIMMTQECVLPVSLACLLETFALLSSHSSLYEPLIVRKLCSS